MILFITRKFPPSVGGMERLSAEMVEAVGALAPSHVIAWRGPRALWPLFVVTAAVRAVAVLMSRPVQIIHAGDPVLAPMVRLLAGIWGIRWAVTVHGLDVVYRSRFYQALAVGSLRRADVVVCISRAARDACVSRGVRAERCVIIPPGIAGEPTLLDRDGARATLAVALGRTLDGAVLLTVGRLVPRKGVAWLVREVLPRLASDRDWTYLVVGDGPDAPVINEAVRASTVAGRVVLAGRLPQPALEAAYAAADLLLLPNLSIPGDMEGFGIVAIEGAARGRLVLAADIDGLTDAVASGENGVLLPPEDPAAWEAAVRRWLRDDEGRAALEARARDYTLRHFHWAMLAPRYLAAFSLSPGAADERWDQAYLYVRRDEGKRRRRLDRFGILPGSLVLDLGCGDGINSRILESLGVRRVVSLDRSERLVRAGRPRRGLAASAYETPFPDGTFDVVLVDSVLHHLDPVPAILEIRRLLKPGGLLCLIEPADSGVRRLLDLVTFSPLARLIPELRQRGRSLAEEWPGYRSWLANERRLSESLRAVGFGAVWVFRTPLSILGKWSKGAEPASKADTHTVRHSLSSLPEGDRM